MTFPPPPPGDRPGHAPVDFRDEQFITQPRPAPQTGWRGVLCRATGGLVNLGPSRAEADRLDVIRRARVPLNACRRIAVISRKGGVGKTTITVGLGHTFASLRPDRVVAVDANPDAGTLGYRLNGNDGRTVTELLADAQHVRRYSDARRYTAQAPSRLEVMASDDDPAITHAFGEDEYREVLEVLERHYNLLLTDTGTDITHPVMSGVLAAADQIVVVVAPSLDGARAASQTLDWLERNGHGGLVTEAACVINGVRRRSRVDLDKIADHFTSRCRAVSTVPWDDHLEAGARTPLEDLRPATRQAYARLAAAVADGFAATRLQGAP